LYNKIKHDIVLEEYLIKEKNFKNRPAWTLSSQV
jgi:hypothetical protein